MGRELLRLLLYPCLIGSFIAVGLLVMKLFQLAPSIFSSVPSPSAHTILIGLVIALRLLILASLAGYFWNFFKWLDCRVLHAVGGRPRLKFQTSAFLGAVVVAWFLFFMVPKLIDPGFNFSLHGDCVTVVRSREGCGYIRACWHWVVYLVLYPSLKFWGWFSSVGSRYLLITPPYTDRILFTFLMQFAFAACIRFFAIYFLGDVAIYTNLNQLSSNFAIRSQILEECGHALTTLYTDLQTEAIATSLASNKDLTREQAIAKLSPSDFQLVLVAHSLGTVIAYDTLNDLFNRARIDVAAAGASSPASGNPLVPRAIHVCEHLRGMLTFGSPLNKTYYFFRDQSAPDELIRAQVIDQLHSFRLLVPQSELPNAPLLPPAGNDHLSAIIGTFRWLNVWAVMDIVSGKLFFYDLPEQDQVCGRLLTYWIPLFAHLTYWKDKRMYEYLWENLLGRTEL